MKTTSIILFIGDRRIPQEYFFKVFKITKDYYSYITMRVIAFDKLEFYEPRKENLLKELS